ncbi:DegT/DnrJ/EryC1/StrS family aminotransferase [Cellulomonas sp.]|uniref:DegT/DnrJ/EryC1/StrS family aminotransferase n=1 Tax=Cellulomonas sp. TaxID=40001 RepID=UPI00344F93F8
MTTQVPFVDLAAQQAEILDAIRPQIDLILTTGAFVGGRPVDDFESAYANFIGVRHCVGVANGTDALELALRGVGLEGGGEVLVPANTFIATAEAVVRAGGHPVFVDVDDDCLLMSPDAVKAAVGAQTRVVMPVHLYGQAAPVEEITPWAVSVDAVLIEDAAQSQGATRHGVAAGALGQVAGTSFYPGKNLGAAGDAGAVLTDDDELADRVRSLANHGSQRKYEHDIIGFNSRMDAIQAVVLRAKLDRLAAWNAARARAAARYEAMLAGIDGVRCPQVLAGNTHVWHLYVIRVPDRDRVLRALQAAGIGAGLHYPVPVHLTPAFRGWGYGPGDFPIAERAAQEILSLPMHPHLTSADQERVVEVLRGALED